MTFSRFKLVLAAVAVGIVVFGSAWLYAQPRRGTGTFGPKAADPAYIVVSTSTPVLFTSQITDRQLKKRSVILVRLDASGQPSDILGRLKDDGRNGDLKANDNIYSLRVTLNESTLGSVSFKVAARFKPGRWLEPESDDDDWDKELSSFNRTTRDRPAERDRVRKLLGRLFRYTFSAPIQVTVDPFALPPDPGEAGKQTLKGIDSDSDGVRDDLQRYIALRFSDSPNTIGALRQRARANQAFILSSDAPQPVVIDIAQQRSLASDCLFSVRRAVLGNEVRAAHEVYNIVLDFQKVLLNTRQRSKAYFAADRKLGGTTSFLRDSAAEAAACEP